MSFNHSGRTSMAVNAGFCMFHRTTLDHIGPGLDCTIAERQSVAARHHR